MRRWPTAAALLLLTFPAQVLAAGPAPEAVVPPQHRWLTFAVFSVVIAITLMITYVAAKRVRTPADFYTAGSSLSCLQNGWAIAGDYLSAASFLGIAGLIYSAGWRSYAALTADLFG